MAACCSSAHPQLPVTFFVTTMSYCHQCQAWSGSVGKWTHVGEGDPVNDVRADISLGPFDRLSDLELWVDDRLEELLNSPGLPWDRG